MAVDLSAELLTCRHGLALGDASLGIGCPLPAYPIWHCMGQVAFAGTGNPVSDVLVQFQAGALPKMRMSRSHTAEPKAVRVPRSRAFGLASDMDVEVWLAPSEFSYKVARPLSTRESTDLDSSSDCGPPDKFEVALSRKGLLSASLFAVPIAKLVGRVLSVAQRTRKCKINLVGPLLEVDPNWKTKWSKRSIGFGQSECLVVTLPQTNMEAPRRPL